MRSATILQPVGKAIGLLLFAAWSLVPIVMIVMSSFKADREIFAVPQRLLFPNVFVAISFCRPYRLQKSGHPFVIHGIEPDDPENEADKSGDRDLYDNRTR